MCAELNIFSALCWGHSGADYKCGFNFGSGIIGNVSLKSDFEINICGLRGGLQTEFLKDKKCQGS